MSNLVRHAEAELKRSGWMDNEGMYGDMIGKAVLDLQKKFADQGHSGMSAGITLALFDKVARFQPLGEITNDPAEWQEVGPSVWQNRRQSEAFSDNGGKTYYLLSESRKLPKRIPFQIRSRIPQKVWIWLLYPIHTAPAPKV